MKRFSIFVMGSVIGLCAASTASPAAQYDRENDRARGDLVCVYKDINYYGAEQCYRVGEEIHTLGAQNSSISSIRVYGRATVTVYEKTAFGGHSAAFTSDVSDLGKRYMQGSTGWSDRIASLRVGAAAGVNNNYRNDDRADAGFDRYQPQQPREGICVYDLPNYEGRSDCWSQGQNISDVARRGQWNGQISSIRLFGARTIAVVYQDTAYRGQSFTVTRNIPDLAMIPGGGRGNNGNGRGQGNGRNFRNWDRQISSLQIQSQRQNR